MCRVEATIHTGSGYDAAVGMRLSSGVRFLLGQRLSYAVVAVSTIQQNTNTNKKLSYCCDSRSYCMQYFNAIHCDRNISISE